MTKEQGNSLKPGIYEIFWKSGGSSLSAIGNDGNGQNWIAPSNWTTPSCPSAGYPTMWRKILMVKRLECYYLESNV